MNWSWPWQPRKPALPEHLKLGRAGEVAARRHLEGKGLRFVCSNYQASRSEIDLIFRDLSVLVIVEVKTRSSEDWSRPASAVDAAKRDHLSRAALEYLRELGNPRISFRFDIVEVLADGGRFIEIRHLVNVFPLSGNMRYHP